MYPEPEALPHYYYSINNGPLNPILIIKAPTLNPKPPTPETL